MSNFKNLIGNIFGRLEVISRLPDHVTSGGNHIVMWQCRCICGNAANVSSNSLTQIKTKSCGCLSIETSRITGEANRMHGGYSASSSYEHQVKYRALVNIKERSKRRGYESDLEIEDLPNLTDSCPVLGLKYNRGSLKDKNLSPSVDRINSNLPYLKKYKNNLVFISHRANRIKSDATLEEIKKVVQYIEAKGG